MIDKATLKKSCVDSYAVFCCVLQEDGWFDPQHEKLCDTIQKDLEDSGCLAALRTGDISLVKYMPQILVVLPRGTLKSTIVTKYLPAWLSIQDPNIRCLITSNSTPNAARKLEDIKGLFDSNQTFRALWPELLPPPGRNNDWNSQTACINRTTEWPEGTFEAVGVRTKVISRHYNIIVEDDTMAPDESDLRTNMVLPSVEDTEKAIGWHNAAWFLLVPKGIRIRVIVTTRWSDFDLVHHVREKGTLTVDFDLPAELNGEPTFSIFYNKEVLTELQRLVGPYMYSCLFLNSPIPAGQRTFQPEWFQSYEAGKEPEGAEFWISIDPAISEKDEACETAICKVFHYESCLFVAKVIHDKLLPSNIIDKAVALALEDLDRCAGFIIETVAFQKSLKYYLRDRLKKERIFKSIIEHNSGVAKTMRIEGLQPLYANRQVFHSTALDRQLETQLLQFPRGRLIDCPDSLAMQLKVYKGLDVVHEEKVVEVIPTNTFSYALDEIRKRSKPKFGSLKSPFGTDIRADLDYASFTGGSN